MKWTIANQITVARMVLSIIFFVLVGNYTPESRQTLMGIGFILYVVASLTDMLDGYLARKLNQVSAFGRILDPIMDKILILGAFIMMLGLPEMNIHGVNPADFVGNFERNLPGWLTGNSAITIQPWMIVVILGREFLISGIRGYSESMGKEFPATWSGKLKMFLQCFAAGTIIFVLAWTPDTTWCVCVKIASVWLAVLVTIYSGVDYIINARSLFVEKKA